MAKKLRVLIGTKKGAFILEGGVGRKRWTMSGPHCETWPIHHAIGDASDGTLYGAGGNEWFGPAVWKSTDQGKTWTHSSKGLAYPAGETPIKAAWTLAVGHGKVYCGVEPAGLFVSADKGETWSHVEGLTDHPTRPQWNPGGAGLLLHSILVNPADAKEMWVGISAAGVFHTSDGGKNWAPRNKGVRADYNPEDQRYPEFGQCCHGLAMAAGDPMRIYQQNHCGMYRSDDGGLNWLSVEKGLPSSFGFPVAAHPRDPDRFYLFPLNGDQKGRFAPGANAAVWTSGDCGDRWKAKRGGLPQGDAYFNVLRQALATDVCKPAGVYLGTSSGALYASLDEGETYAPIAQNLPSISSVETVLLDA